MEFVFLLVGTDENGDIAEGGVIEEAVVHRLVRLSFSVASLTSGLT